MSSWVFETYENGNLFAEYRWNKGNTYEVNVGHITSNGFVSVDLFTNTYNTKESAKRAFKRQIKKIEKGEC